MDEKPKPIESIDWRTRVATTIAEDTKSPNGSVIYSKGTPITVTTFVKLENNVIRFNDPSAPALFLNQSYNSYQQAISNYPKILELSSKNIDYSTVVFDYLENIFASIIFCLYCIGGLF